MKNFTQLVKEGARAMSSKSGGKAFSLNWYEESVAEHNKRHQQQEQERADKIADAKSRSQQKEEPALSSSPTTPENIDSNYCKVLAEMAHAIDGSKNNKGR